MLNKLNIGSRLVVLISVQTVMLLIVGLTAVFGLHFASNTTSSLNDNVIEQVKLNQLNEVVRGDLLGSVNSVYNGKSTWSQGKANILAASNLFFNDWDEYKEDKSLSEVKQIDASMSGELLNITRALDELNRLMDLQDQEQFAKYVENEFSLQINPFLTELNEQVSEQQLVSEQLFDESIQTSELFLYGSIAIISFGLIVAGVLGVLIYRSISKPIQKISNTVDKVSDGNYYARTEVEGSDELGQLGIAFDGLLEDKVATLVEAEKDNEQLNESVISLLQAVSQLSKRDLTVKVPVTEDITGPVADALNQMTTETSQVLSGVRRISEEVAKASAVVKNQTDAVISVADEERHEVEETAKELANAAKAMTNIADLAQTCNAAAEDAIDTTHTALETVTSTIQGISGIRDTIHETEKRIKRLGERSQEITRAVNLINSISERTHILALNASMHAASAGEAGRGFAVVADEVQRLAENARDATSQIATLVSNIQVETADTVTTMNDVITQVVEGSSLAEQAGEQMKKTEDRTNHLVQSVRQIARQSQDQARISTELQVRTDQIKASTKKTSERLQQQTQQTTRLVQYAKGLLTAVQVFKLPVAKESTKKPADKTASVVGIDQRKAS